MIPLTIQMLVKNNEETIDSTLESIVSLIQNIGAQLIIGDLGCTDDTIKKCEAYDAKIFRLSLNDDFSQARNELISKVDSKWHFSIQPFETLLNSHIINDIVNNKVENKIFNLNVIQGDVITKQIRIWKKETNLKFKNPVYETIIGKGFDTGVNLIAVQNDMSKHYLDLAIKWMKKSPIMAEPVYYVACSYLAQKNWNSFINYADMYLHKDKNESLSTSMIRYYYSMVQCYIEKNYEKAIRYLLPCLAINPTMAEFWCLLADIYYAINQLEKAENFYENAIILGSKRLKNDDWPVEISKYKEYPLKMIEACEKIKQSSKIYGTNSDKPHLHL